MGVWFFGGGVFGWLVGLGFVCVGGVGFFVVLFCFALFCMRFLGLVLVFIIFQTRVI